jgi:hypothetical protein
MTDTDSRVLTACTVPDCGATVQTDGDQVPTSSDTFEELVYNLVDEDVPTGHEHVLVHEVLS